MFVIWTTDMTDENIVYAFVHETTQRDADCQYIRCEGSSNISPAVAVVDNCAHVVWESNSGRFRGIYACHIDQRGPGPVRRLSSPQANSYNPSIVALADGSVFAAWDSVRTDGANIYGSRFRRGQWLEEKRITNGRRIERHPSSIGRLATQRQWQPANGLVLYRRDIAAGSRNIPDSRIL
jgi:hypothetical protein